MYKSLPKGLKSHQQNVDCQKSKRQARSQSEKTSDFKCDKCPVMCTSKKSLKVNISSVVEFQRWWVLKSTSSSKIGHVLENKVVQKLKLDFFFIQKWSPKLIILNDFFLKKFC